MSGNPNQPDLAALRSAIGARRTAETTIRANLHGLVGRLVRTHVPTDSDAEAVYKAVVTDVDIGSLTVHATSGAESWSLSIDELIDLVSPPVQLGKEPKP